MRANESERISISQGKWALTPSEALVVSEDGGRVTHIAEVVSDGICAPCPAEAQANARAIAALPELVEALRDCTKAIDCIGAVGETPPHYVDMANAKLGKAYSAGQAALRKAGCL